MVGEEKKKKGGQGRDLLIGAHLSIAGGVQEAARRAARIGCRTFQLFTKNSNRWEGKEIPESDAREFRERVAEHGFSHVTAHDSYLINVASPDDDLRRRSEQALAGEVERANLLRLDYLVMHPGAHRDAGVEEGLERIAGSLKMVMEDSPAEGVTILLETTAGQGSSLGSRFEELRWLLDQVGSDDRLGICLDTCHIFVAGYDLRDSEAYQSTMKEFDAVIGLQHLKLLHLNDTLKEFGSHVDRHHHIGKGKIGVEGFRQIMTDDRFRSIPKIIETPKGDDESNDLENLALLRSLCE